MFIGHKLNTWIKIKGKEYYPIILFVVKFLSIYAILNFAHLLYIKFSVPDTIFFTDIAAEQMRLLLNIMGQEVSLKYDNTYPQILVIQNGNAIVSVLHGCNGVNLYVTFLAFMLSFFKPDKKVLIFSMVGLLLLNLANVVRVTFLFFITLHLPEHFEFLHHYVLTGLLFIFVFYLWFYAAKKLR